MSQLYDRLKTMEQADLFGSLSPNYKQPKVQKPDFLSRHKLHLRLDQALIASIILLGAFVLVFSFGVEKGKGLAGAEMKALKAKYDETVAQLGTSIRKKKELPSKSEPTKAPKKEETIVEHIKIEPTPPQEIEKLEKAQSKATEDSGRKGNYTIQMVTYTTERQAHRLVEKLNSGGHQTYLIPSGKYIQVCLESFESKSVARKALKRFKMDGVIPSDAYVRTFPK